MPIACAALGAHQIVELSDSVDVRALYPDGTSLYVCASTHNLPVGANNAIAFCVETEDANGALPFVIGSAINRPIVHDICRTVFVEEERRVYSVYLRQWYGFAPSLMWVGCLHEEIAHAHAGGNHVECLVLRIVFDIRRKNSTRYTLAV